MVYRKTNCTDQIHQVDIGSTQSVNSPKYLICGHQPTARADLPNKRTNISVFDHLDVRTVFCSFERTDIIQITNITF